MYKIDNAVSNHTEQLVHVLLYSIVHADQTVVSGCKIYAGLCVLLVRVGLPCCKALSMCQSRKII